MAQVPRWITVLTGYPPKSRRGQTAPASPTPSPPGKPAGGDSGFAVTPHKRGGSVAATWAARIAIGLLLLAGFRVSVITPIFSALHHPAPAAHTASGLDAGTASRLATEFTADYWSYDSTDSSRRAAALARWMGTDAGSTPKIAGTGQLRADIVTPGQVVRAGGDAAIVAVTARVTPATLADNAGTQAAPDTDTPPAYAAADPGPATAPWQAGKPMWLTLDVVIVRTGGLHVTGATLSGDAPAALPAPTSEVDTSTTGSTGDLPKQMFTALSGNGQLDYLTVPHVQLTGLSGAVSLVDVSGWSVAPDHPGAGTRYATANVSWQVTGTQVQITEPYALTMTDSEGRWLLDAVGPRIEE